MITECEIVLERRIVSENDFLWSCTFYVKDKPDQFNFRLYTNTLSSQWEYGILRVTNSDGIISESQYSFTTVHDHLFEQFVQIIKKQSRYRLSLLGMIERNYNTPYFQPKEYILPDNIIFDE